jgi:hypothetical protein
MSAAAKLEIVRGEVSKVQFTSETVPAPGKRRLQSVNKMRVFLREAPGGPERDFTFTDTTVGVHEGHTVAIARASVRGHKGPILLAFINESTGQRDESDGGFARAAQPYAMFGPRWKALGLAAGLFFLGYIVSRFFVSPDKTAATWISWPLMLAFLAYPIFWGGVALWDQLMQGRAVRDGEGALRAEIADRLAKAKAPPAPAPASQPQAT